MDKLYIALKPFASDPLSQRFEEGAPASQIITDDHVLARYIKQQWECYLFTGLKKIESVETTVIEKNETV